MQLVFQICHREKLGVHSENFQNSIFHDVEISRLFTGILGGNRGPSSGCCCWCGLLCLERKLVGSMNTFWWMAWTKTANNKAEKDPLENDAWVWPNPCISLPWNLFTAGSTMPCNSMCLRKTSLTGRNGRKATLRGWLCKTEVVHTGWVGAAQVCWYLAPRRQGPISTWYTARRC